MPRLPSRFETGGRAEEAAFEVDETATAPVVAESRAARGSARPERDPGVGDTATATDLPTSGRPPAPAPLTSERATAEVAASASHDAVADASRAPERPPTPERARALQPVAAVVVPAVSVAPAAADDRRSQRTDAAPDVVHVTIGRIEVRATVAAPAPPAPQAKPAERRESLSLHDYLRGERAR